MVVHGLQKLTLLDFPGHSACTVFTGSCNWRCPFCQNASLVMDPGSQPVIPEEEIFAFLEKRRGLLDGVAITGGEPTLQKDLPDFARRVKDRGFAVKLDTNGSNPALLRRMLEEGLADYVAMDIKTCRENYPGVVGREDYDPAPVEESAALLLEGRVPYEFRTTVVKELHGEEDFERIGEWLRGAPLYFLQGFKDSGDLLQSGLHACTPGEMRRFRDVAAPYFGSVSLRGVD